MLILGQLISPKDLDGKELVEAYHCQQKGGKMQWAKSDQFFVKTLQCEYPKETPIEFVNN